MFSTACIYLSIYIKYLKSPLCKFFLSSICRHISIALHTYKYLIPSKVDDVSSRLEFLQSVLESNHLLTLLKEYFQNINEVHPLYLFIYLVHSLIRGVLIQSCSIGAKNFTNYVLCHPQFSISVIQNIENRCAILTHVCLCLLLSK